VELGQVILKRHPFQVWQRQGVGRQHLTVQQCFKRGQAFSAPSAFHQNQNTPAVGFVLMQRVHQYLGCSQVIGGTDGKYSACHGSCRHNCASSVTVAGGTKFRHAVPPNRGQISRLPQGEQYRPCSAAT